MFPHRAPPSAPSSPVLHAHSELSLTALPPPQAGDTRQEDTQDPPPRRQGCLPALPPPVSPSRQKHHHSTSTARSVCASPGTCRLWPRPAWASQSHVPPTPATRPQNQHAGQPKLLKGRLDHVPRGWQCGPELLFRPRPALCFLQWSKWEQQSGWNRTEEQRGGKT